MVNAGGDATEAAVWRRGNGPSAASETFEGAPELKWMHGLKIRPSRKTASDDSIFLSISERDMAM